MMSAFKFLTLTVIDSKKAIALMDSINYFTCSSRLDKAISQKSKFMSDCSHLGFPLEMRVFPPA